MKIVIVVLLCSILAGMAYFVKERESEKSAAREEALRFIAEEERKQAAEAAVIAIKKLADSATEQAIKEKRVVKGMTKAQVERAWGDDYGKRRSYDIENGWKDMGVREIWTYSGNRAVYFDYEGRVLFENRAY